MATDLTDILINRRAAKYDTEQFGERPVLAPQGNWNAGNFQQMFSQGIGNLLGAIDAPAQRAEAARQEAIAAEQVGYEREQDAFSNQIQTQNQERADAKLSLLQLADARQAERERKSDLAATANTGFQAKAFELGENVRNVVQTNKSALSNLSGQGVLVTNADGSFSLTDGATPEQQAEFATIQDVDAVSQGARHDLLKYVSGLNSDDIQGNEIADVGQGIAMLDAAYKPSTQATQAENDLYQRKLTNLQSDRDRDLARTTGSLSNQPELLSIQSDLASMPSGAPALDEDIVTKAIDGNPRLESDALAEVDTWKASAAKGNFGKDLKDVINTPWGEYYLAKAIQKAGGDPWFGVGSFKDKDMAKRVREVMRQTDQVRNVVKEQAEITTGYAAELLKLDQLFKSGTTGRAVTK